MPKPPSAQRPPEAGGIGGAASCPPSPRRHDAPRLPSFIASIICAYIVDSQTSYRLATLVHLHRTQTAALLSLRSRGGLRKTPLDFVRSVSLLDFFKQNLSRQAIGVLYSAEAMDSADSAEILQWWRDSGLETRYTEDAMILASGNGQIWNLQWWKDCGLPLKYSARAMSEASKMGWTHVLQWWKDSGLELKYDEAAITFASENGHVRVLQWWKDSGLPLEYDTEAAECATLNGRVEVLDWWLSSGLELKCDHWRLPVGVPRCA